MKKPIEDKRKECARDRIRIQLAKRIVYGYYPENTQLKELALAKEFNVSQAPVREALRELEILGLVQSEPYCGTRVLSLCLSDLKDSYELRALIEGAAMLKSATASQSDKETMAKLLEELREASLSHNIEKYSSAAFEFHKIIVSFSGNQQFLKAWNNLHPEILIRIAVQSMESDLSLMVKKHEEIVLAIEEKNISLSVKKIQDFFDLLLKKIISYDDTMQ